MENIIAIEKRSFMFSDEWFTLELEIMNIDKRQGKIIIIHVLSGKTYEIQVGPSFVGLEDIIKLSKIPRSLFIHVIMIVANTIVEEIEKKRR